MALFFIGKNFARKVGFALINCKLYLVDRLKTNILIGNDIIGLEKISIDINSWTTIISSCGI